MSENTFDEPRLGPNFAGRVMEAADREVARRRRHRQFVVTTLFLGGATAVALWLGGGGTTQRIAQSQQVAFASRPTL